MKSRKMSLVADGLVASVAFAWSALMSKQMQSTSLMTKPPWIRSIRPREIALESSCPIAQMLWISSKSGNQTRRRRSRSSRWDYSWPPPVVLVGGWCYRCLLRSRLRSVLRLCVAGCYQRPLLPMWLAARDAYRSGAGRIDENNEGRVQLFTARSLSGVARTGQKAPCRGTGIGAQNSLT